MYPGGVRVTPWDSNPTSCTPYTPSPGVPSHFHLLRYKLYMDDIQICVPVKVCLLSFQTCRQMSVGHLYLDVPLGSSKFTCPKVISSPLFELSTHLPHLISEKSTSIHWLPKPES